MWTNIYRANRPIQIRNYISRKMHTHGFEEFERKFNRNKRKMNQSFFLSWRWWWRNGHPGQHRRVSRVLELECELEEELLSLAIPIRPKLALALVHFTARELERDRLVGLAGEEKILPLLIGRFDLLFVG